ncbi:MBL fold metallo-hydrolase [Erythrobacter sp. NE805]|uniref:MBL fold metallo-hydrolase n=1 Tax=Erythrobacter sp. NE805 TaxID=3389875 RepID=UPI00396B42F6
MNDRAGAPQQPSHHKPGGGYRNPPGSPAYRAGLRDFLRFLLWDMRRAKLPPIPDGHVASTRPDLAALADNQIAWLGHACFAMRIGGKLVLTDPYLSRNAGPFGLGPKRFLPATVKAGELPRLDLIVISHNHYDHLDTAALTAYRWRAETPVVCPLGVGPLLRRQGFAEVVELDWWERHHFGPISVTALPAVHFSGRGLFDRNRTLWASMAIASSERRVWFGGDTGYGAVFREIGERAGPFDLALVGIGAYEPRIIMEASHATPEEAVTIARDIGARAAVGMHWGSIMLTPEDPFEAPIRFRRAALEQQYGEANAWIMQVGEVRSF